MAVIKLAHLDTAHRLKCICQFLRIERYRLRPHVNKIKIHTLHCQPERSHVNDRQLTCCLHRHTFRLHRLITHTIRQTLASSGLFI